MSDPAVVESTYYRMPSFGADMEQGTVLQWFVQPGDEVHRGDIVALIDTEKAEIEAEIFVDGVIGSYVVEIGTAVPVGTPLATILPLGAEAPSPSAQPNAPATPTAPPPPAPKPARAPTPATAPTGSVAEPAAWSWVDEVLALDAPTVVAASTAVRSSPLARRLASERGLDLNEVDGSGPCGAVVARDLDASDATVAPRAEAPPTVDPRAAIAKLMARSKREIPHYYLSVDIDLGRVIAWLTETNLERPVAERVIPAALLLRATALAAAAVPELNGNWLDGRFQPAEAVNVGVAIAKRGGGLLAPAILAADQLDVHATMAALRDLATRARKGGLRSSEMSGPTITVTNLGDSGVTSVYGVIYPPQVAMVGFGRISERAWVDNGVVVARPVVTATLAADHRATDGLIGARFLATLAANLADPTRLEARLPKSNPASARPAAPAKSNGTNPDVEAAN